MVLGGRRACACPCLLPSFSFFTCLTSERPLAHAPAQCVGGFFGMNLDSGLQEAPRLFNVVAITTSTGCLLAFGIFIYFLHAHKLLYY